MYFFNTTVFPFVYIQQFFFLFLYHVKITYNKIHLKWLLLPDNCYSLIVWLPYWKVANHVLYISKIIINIDFQWFIINFSEILKKLKQILCRTFWNFHKISIVLFILKHNCMKTIPKINIFVWENHHFDYNFTESLRANC